jgi:L-seryl-tRNA(Ser) seleniumtransferase
VVALDPGRAGAAAVEARLRRGTPPVLVRVKEGRILVDLRTVAPAEESALVEALRNALGVEREDETP